MRAIKEARKLIQKHPDVPACEILARLVLSLENESNFRLSDIYKLDQNTFSLAVRVVTEWRLDRYYEGKAKLFDVSYQIAEMSQARVSDPRPSDSATPGVPQAE